MIDSTYVNAQRAAFGAKGSTRHRRSAARAVAGPSASVHTLADVIGRPYVLMLTAGNVSDIKAVPTLLERAGRMRCLSRIRAMMLTVAALTARCTRCPRHCGAAQPQARHPL